MGETCAVCKKGKGPEKCEVCGFSDNGFINRQFPIPEDAKNWNETVVKPYRIQWEAKKREDDLLAQLEAAKKKEAELIRRLEEAKKNYALTPQPYSSPVLVKAMSAVLVFLANVIKKQLWVLISIVLGGIIGIIGGYDTSYNSLKGLCTIICIITGVIGSASSKYSGIIPDQYSRHTILSFTVALLVSITGGVVGGFVFIRCIVWLFSKIPYDFHVLIVNTPYIAIGALCGWLGFIGGFYTRRLMATVNNG